MDKTSDKKVVDNYALEVENKNKALELKQSKDRLRYTTAIGVLVLLLAAGLLFGYYRQHKSRRELAAQNALIQKQADQLQSLDLAKSRFFANVSHELRTPLTLLTSPVKTLLKDEQLTEKQIRLLHMAERAGQQLGQLVNDILDLRKLDMGKMTVNAEPTELRPYFQTCFAQFESLAEQKQIDYALALDLPDETIADLDREKCRQILFNLLSNAFKFTPAGGNIAAVVRLVEGALHISVADSGAGIHPDDLPHVFDRYFQSGRPDKPAEGGTGIGLALCREYAQLFGGTIRAESPPGRGAVLTVSFPVALYDHIPAALQYDTVVGPDPAPTSAADISGGLASNGQTGDNEHHKPVLLLVEDNPDLREYVRFILQEKYHVVAAENGQAALKVVRDDWSDMSLPETHAPSLITPTTHAPSLIPYPSPLIIPDLVLSDLMMPVMDGYQLLETLKSNDATRHIPFIMLTARAEVQDKLKALRIGVDDYLTKPFDEEELLARIDNLLKNQAARRAAAAMPVLEPAPVPIMSQPDRAWLEAFEAYVQKHYTSDLLSVASLAHAFAMSESTLLRQLKRLTGLSPLQYIQEVRLDEARRLLENRAYNSIAQVASKVGYDDARTFTRSFKQRFGKLPSEVMEG